MKGGVTSGVVYPEAIYEISRAFDLKSIGGTSAGAIAAALAAAAQYRRVRAQSDPALGDAESGYERLRQIPQFLGEDQRLFRLFAPNRATKPLFAIVIDLFDPKRGIAAKLSCLARAYPLHAAAGLLPAVGYASVASRLRDEDARPIHYVLAGLMGAAAASVASAAGFAWDLLRDMPRNYYGLATGIDDGDPKNESALCSWLTRELELTAGLEPGRTPLTFGMLWNPSAPPAAFAMEDPAPPADRRINLQMMTTSLTEGRPYQFPARTARFYFKPQDMRRFFPDHVVQWMIDCRRSPATEYPELVPLPPIGDLPIVVATRMSLAFPILLSAVPLQAVDYTEKEPLTPEPVWFSDGGLTSNFPIAMFDSPMPRWPTLALNLGSFGPRTPANGVIITHRANEGRLMRFQRITGLPSFFGAIFNAVQNWGDTMQATVPGIRDRIATIALRPEEGGLNLDMDAQAIEALRRRGADAAKALVERFAEPSTLNPQTEKPSWEAHRWTRFRVAMSMLREYLGRFTTAWDSPQPGDVPYGDLIEDNQPHTIPRELYELPNSDMSRDMVARAAEAVRDAGELLSDTAELEQNTPLPRPVLVQRPQLDK